MRARESYSQLQPRHGKRPLLLSECGRHEGARPSGMLRKCCEAGNAIKLRLPAPSSFRASCIVHHGQPQPLAVQVSPPHDLSYTATAHISLFRCGFRTRPPRPLTYHRSRASAISRLEALREPDRTVTSSPSTGRPGAHPRGIEAASEIAMFRHLVCLRFWHPCHSSTPSAQ